MSAPLKPLPVWADVALIPLVNVAAAFVISGFVVLAIGENPLQAVQSLVLGALGDLEGIGYTLFYATSFIFTGLSVAICFHAGLFNIGTEGQAYIGGLGAALVALHFGFLPGYTLAIAAIIGAAVFGAAFAAIPGYLQAYRDSHIVITTIMFNYIASAIMGYVLVNVLRKPGQMNAETEPFRDTALVPQFHDVLAHFGITWPVTPFNLSFLLALLCCLAVWLLIWRTRLGYEIRTVGANPTAAVYGGISPARVTVITTLLVGRARGRRRGQCHPRRPASAHPRIRRRLRLRRHRGRADGPGASGRHHPRRDPVRRPLSGRSGALDRHAQDQPRHDRRHPGPRRAVRRRARAHVPPPGRDPARAAHRRSRRSDGR